MNSSYSIQQRIVVLLAGIGIGGLFVGNVRGAEPPKGATAAVSNSPSADAPPAGHQGPWLSNVSISRVQGSPSQIDFSFDVRPAKAPIQWQKATMWFFLGTQKEKYQFGEQSILLTFRNVLGMELENRGAGARGIITRESKGSLVDYENNRLFSYEDHTIDLLGDGRNCGGRDYIGVACHSYQSAGKNRWSATAKFGIFDLSKAEIQLRAPTEGSTPDSHPATAVPATLVMWDEEFTLSNELRLLVNLKNGTVRITGNEGQR